jgi:hypothetical protein
MVVKLFSVGNIAIPWRVRSTESNFISEPWILGYYWQMTFGRKTVRGDGQAITILAYNIVQTYMWLK